MPKTGGVGEILLTAVRGRTVPSFGLYLLRGRTVPSFGIDTLFAVEHSTYSSMQHTHLRRTAWGTGIEASKQPCYDMMRSAEKKKKTERSYCTSRQGGGGGQDKSLID